MTTNHHTPIVAGASNEAATWNNPMSQIDAAITSLDVAVDVQLALLEAEINSRIDNLGVEAGNANAEVTAARTAIEYGVGSEPASLSETIRWAARGFYNALAFGIVADGNGDGGGTNNRTAINLALATIGTNGGGVLYFPPGIYRCDSDITIADDIMLKGAGAGASIIDTKNNISSNLIQSATNIDNFTVEDLGFTGSILNNTGKLMYFISGRNITINRCKFQNYQMGGPHFAGGSYLRVTNNFFENVNFFEGDLADPDYGVIAFMQSGATDFVISGNLCTGTAYGSGISAQQCERGLIFNNDIRLLLDNTETMGMYLQACKSLIITGNYIENASDEGIVLNSSTTATEDSSGHIINGNRVHNCRWGIVVASQTAPAWLTKRTIISNNNVSAPEGAGRESGIRIINAHDCIITNNIIVDQSVVAGAGLEMGLHMVGGVQDTRRAIVSGNKIFLCEVGIDSQATHSNFIGNSIQSCVTGISLNNAQYCVFMGNFIAGATTGLSAPNASDASYDGTIWHSNVMNSNTTNYAGTHYAKFVNIMYANKMGIGTSIPLYALHVTDQTAGTVDLAVIGGADVMWKVQQRVDALHFISSDEGGSNPMPMILRAAAVSATAPNLYLGPTGHIGIGMVAPVAKASIEQASVTGAVPVLSLKQADLSEEYIRFMGTPGAGNPTNVTALGAYYGRVRVYVEGVGAKWMALYD